MASYHRCHNCGCETDVANALSAFEENPHCRQCGLSVAESDSKMQDDLVNMMSQHFHLSPAQHNHEASMPSTPQVSPQPAPITYITQHYHHSSHLVSPSDRPTSIVLEEAGVNASVLLPSQILLFQNADNEQRQRLIELWRIAPPTPGNQIPPSASQNWPTTSMDQEEEAARIRWEALEGERLKALVAPDSDSRNNVEPYMVSGYSDLSNFNGVAAPTEYQGSSQQSEEEYRRCKDPVYNHSRHWWQVGDQEPMEHQYGLLQAMMWGGSGYSQTKGAGADEDTDML